MGFVTVAGRRLGRRSRINYGTGGASVSYRLGPLTVNSRGRVSLRLGCNPVAPFAVSSSVRAAQ
jgi:hypothetical protein